MCVDLNDELTAHQLANLLHRLRYREMLDIPAIRDVMARTRGTANIRIGDSGLDRLARQGAADELPELIALVR